MSSVFSMATMLAMRVHPSSVCSAMPPNHCIGPMVLTVCCPFWFNVCGSPFSKMCLIWPHARLHRYSVKGTALT